MAAAIPITVTYLEMLRRPGGQRPHPPLGYDNGNLMLLRAQEPPVHFYRYLYDAVGRDHVWVDRKRRSDADLAREIHDPKVEVYVLYVAGAPAGYFELDFRKKAECDLAYFGLIKDFTGRRLGPYFLGAALDAAWSREIERLTVNTNTLDHPKALPLYQRMGFSPYAQRQAEIVPLGPTELVSSA
jgi:GNAT superfamily N-acetyltransferase